MNDLNIARAPSSLTFSVIRTLVLYSLAEHQLGHATTVRVTADGHAFSVGDDGRGHAIARTVAGAPYLKFIYTHLDYPFATREPAPVQLQGLAMSLLNTLCSELEVVVRKPDATLRQTFRHGVSERHEVSDTVSSATGNTISGRIDPALSPAVSTDAAIERWLRGIQTAHPALKLWFNDQPLRAEPSGRP